MSTIIMTKKNSAVPEQSGAFIIGRHNDDRVWFPIPPEILFNSEGCKSEVVINDPKGELLGE